jgi:hypothetical protein
VRQEDPFDPYSFATQESQLHAGSSATQQSLFNPDSLTTGEYQFDPNPFSTGEYQFGPDPFVTGEHQLRVGSEQSPATHTHNTPSTCPGLTLSFDDLNHIATQVFGMFAERLQSRMPLSNLGSNAQSVGQRYRAPPPFTTGFQTSLPSNSRTRSNLSNMQPVDEQYQAASPLSSASQSLIPLDKPNQSLLPPSMPTPLQSRKSTTRVPIGRQPLAPKPTEIGDVGSVPVLVQPSTPVAGHDESSLPGPPVHRQRLLSIIDHMHTVVVGGVDVQKPLGYSERNNHGRHDRRLCFWTQPNNGITRALRQSDLLNEHGCVDRDKLSKYTDSLRDILCQICHKYVAATFPELLEHVKSDDQPTHKLSIHRKDVPCSYGLLGFTCGHNDRKEKRCSKGVLGARLYHTLFGEVLKCECRLPFASVQHLALHRPTCHVSPATTKGPSLKSWFMHAYGSNYDQLDMSLYRLKASWVMQISFPESNNKGKQEIATFGKIARDADIPMARKLKSAGLLTIALVQDSNFRDID